MSRVVVAASLGLWLAGCSTSGKFSDMFGSHAPAGDVSATPAAEPAVAQDATGSVTPPLGAPTPAAPGLYGADPNDDLNRGKQQYRANNFGLAEHYFRRAAESHPRDAEAWLGLAASYDRLRRFDLADRAYAQAIGIIGPTPEVLNNQGYSYMLRGDTKRARAILLEAQRKAPGNKYVTNNLALLEESYRKGKAIK
jgi:Flp pilus assembly protein TadD